MILQTCTYVRWIWVLLWMYSIQRVNSVRLQSKGSYLIAAPVVIRPAQVVQISVSIYEVQHDGLLVSAVITKDGKEYAGDKRPFTEPTTKLLQLKIPEGADNGTYHLRIFGQAHLTYGYLFYNETQLIFQPKYVSVFIQTDKNVYERKQKCRFRIIAVTPDLMPVSSGSITVYIKDKYDRIMRRFFSKQVFNGIYENVLDMKHPRVYGWWTIEVHGWGHTYTHKFNNYKFYTQNINVNVSVPAYILDNEYGFEGIIMSNLSKGFPLKGNGTVKIELEKDDQQYPIIKHISQMKGLTSFMLPMSDIARTVGGKDKLPGTKIKATISTYDWYEMDQRDRPTVVKSEIYSSDIRMTFVGGTIRTFKPGFSFPIVIAFYLEDGTRYNNLQFRTITIMLSIHKLSGDIQNIDLHKVIPDSGIVEAIYMTKEDDKFIKAQVSLSGYKNFPAELTASRHQTRSGQYIHLTSSSLSPKANTYMILTVRTTSYIPVLHYMVLSKGNIQFQDSLTMKSRQKTWSVALSKLMIPQVKVIIYGIFEGEVLADSLTLQVKGIRNNGLNVSIKRGKDLSRDTVEMRAIGDPGSLVAFSAQPYEFYNKGLHSFLTEYKVEEELESYLYPYNESFKQTFYGEENRPTNVYYNTPSYAIDPNTTFQLVGLAVFTDAELYRIPGYELCNYTLGYRSCYDNTCYSVEDECNGVRQCEDGADELFCESKPAIKRPDHMANLFYEDFWFDKTYWAWKTHYTKYYGQVEFQIPVPFRPRTWVVTGVSLSYLDGLSFQEHPARIEHDSTASWGEQLGIQVTVFNYWEKPLEAILILLGSDKYKFINVESFGVVSSYDPRTTVGDIQTMVYLEPGEVRMIHFPVLPTTTGTVTVTVIGESLIGRYTASHSVKITMPGITNTYHTPHFIDLINKGSVLIPDLWIPVPERFLLPEMREHLFIPGSQEATVSLVGDFFGPGFTTSIPSYKSVFGFTDSSAEQVAFGLSYNILLIRYLKMTNRLKQDTYTKVLTNIASNLQSMTSFIREDGSSSMNLKAPKDIGCTATLLHALYLMYDTEWVDILYIDLSMVGKMAVWLSSQQNNNGGFIPKTTVYDIRMRSNLTASDGTLLYLSMTAHAIIGLQGASTIVTGDAASIATNAIHKAAEYLSTYLMDIKDPYEMCIVTHALQLANHRAQGDAFTLMRKMARVGDYVYWSPKVIPPNLIEIFNTLQYQHPRSMPLLYSSEAVEATSYALMVYVRNNWFTEAHPIMAWLQTQRNHDRGFIGAPDTLMAMEALIEYTRRDTNRELHSMVVNLAASASADWDKHIRIQGQHNTKYTMVQVPHVFGSVRASAQGTGRALLQMKSQVNVEYPYQIRRPDISSFDLRVDEMIFTGRNFSHLFMKICARWLLTDISPTSGNVLLEVQVPTGFFVKKDYLRKNTKGSGVVRSRYTKHRVVYLMEYISTNWHCYKMEADRRWPVANTSIQHEIWLYDTKSPGFQNKTLYTTYGLFHMDICQACASFQCPYCPYYNSASYHRIDTALIHLFFVYLLYRVIQTVT